MKSIRKLGAEKVVRSQTNFGFIIQVLFLYISIVKETEMEYV